MAGHQKVCAFLFPVLLRERSASVLLQNGVFCKELVWYAGGKNGLQCAMVEGYWWLCDLDLVMELQSSIQDAIDSSVIPQHECGVCDSPVPPAEPTGKGRYV